MFSFNLYIAKQLLHYLNLYKLITQSTGGKTTTTTRTHSDGHKIRTETFSYTKGNFNSTMILIENIFIKINAGI